MTNTLAWIESLGEVLRERRMERRSRRRRTLRRQKQPLPPSDVSVQGNRAPPQWSDGDPAPPHAPGSSSRSRRVEMVERIRAERRNIAPEALTRHHLATSNNNGANNNGENNSATESPKAEKEPNFVSGLIKRLSSDQTTFELVC